MAETVSRREPERVRYGVTRALLTVVLLSFACSDPTAPLPPLPTPDSGEMSIEIQGAVHDTGTWGAFGQFRDLLATDTNELSLLGGQSLDTTINRNLTVIFPARLDTGTFSIGRYVPGAALVRSAYVISDTEFYASIPGGSLTISDAQYPPRPGLESGLMTGTLTFQAVRLVVGLGGPVETGDTIQVRASFAAHWSHLLRPNVAVTLTGGPVTGTSVRIDAQSADDDHGGRLVSWEADLHTGGPIFPFEISEEFRLLGPAVGSFPLANIHPVAYRDPAQWPAAFGAVFYRDDPRIAFSASGTVNVTRYVAPTDAYYGEIQGTLNGRFALWANDSTVTADTAQVSATFAVQLWPLGGIPVSPPALTSAPISGLLRR